MRPGGIFFRGLTNEIVRRLPEPYDLIAEWTKYVNLEFVLGLGAFHLVCCSKVGDALVYDLDEARFSIPTALDEMTEDYVQRVVMPRYGRCGVLALFWDEERNGCLTPRDFRDAVRQALARVLSS